MTPLFAHTHLPLAPSIVEKRERALRDPFLDCARDERGEFGSLRGSEAAEHGFTLVEVLVALLIFGMLAAGGVAILSFSVRAQGVTAAKLDDIGALNRTLSLMSADLAQAVNRPTRDERGTRLPAFVGEAGGAADPALRFVRGGWSNPDAAPRPGLQKVAYRVAGGVLERLSYPMLDGAAPPPPAALLTGVADARLRYRYRGAWSDRWDGANGAALPDAVELRITRTDRREYRQMLLVGTRYEPPQTVEAPGARI